MADDILQLEGDTYYSSKKAAEEAGYTRDYISRLCRNDEVKARRVGRAWFVEKESLEQFQENQEKAKEERRQELSEKLRKRFDKHSFDNSDEDDLEQEADGASDTGDKEDTTSDSEKSSEETDEAVESPYSSDDAPLYPELNKERDGGQDKKDDPETVSASVGAEHSEVNEQKDKTESKKHFEEGTESSSATGDEEKKEETDQLVGKNIAAGSVALMLALVFGWFSAHTMDASYRSAQQIGTALSVVASSGAEKMSNIKQFPNEVGGGAREVAKDIKEVALHIGPTVGSSIALEKKRFSSFASSAGNVGDIVRGAFGDLAGFSANAVPALHDARDNTPDEVDKEGVSHSVKSGDNQNDTGENSSDAAATTTMKDGSVTSATSSSGGVKRFATSSGPFPVSPPREPGQ